MFETMNSQVQQSQQALKGAFTAQIGRLAAMYDEIGRLEEAGLSLAAATIDGSSEWLKKSVESGAKPGAATATFGAFHKFAEEHAARMAAYANEATRLGGAARVTEAYDEYARLLKASLRYGSQMAAAWRTLAVEAARRTAESITPAV